MKLVRHIEQLRVLGNRITILKFNKMLEISSPIKQILTFQFIRIWVECGHAQQWATIRKIKKIVDQGLEKSDY